MKTLMLILILVLLIVCSLFDASSQTAAGEQRPHILWRQEVGFQPIDIQVGDLNGDSNPDVVIGYSIEVDPPKPSIVAIDSVGKVLWRFSTQEAAWHVAIGDIDGDGMNDVAGYETQLPSFLYAITGNGQELWRYQLPITGSGNERADHVKIGDVNGDGHNEVIVGAAVLNRLFIFDSLGNVVLSYNVPSGGISSVELADLTRNNAQDVIISYDGGIQAIDGTGALLWNFSNPVRLGDSAVGDINNDGKPDIVVVEWFGNKVYAIDNSGSLLWAFEQQGDTGSVALGDISGNGKLDIVVGSEDGHVYLIDGNGQLIWTFDTKANLIMKVDVGDLDGDRRNEVVAATVAAGQLAENGGVYAINSDGNLMWFLPARIGTINPDGGQRGFRDLVVADIDRDEVDEVIAVSEDEFAYAA